MADPRGLTPPNGGRFPTTRLGLVLAAAVRDGERESREALETLCQLYWYPLYAFIRRQGRGVEESQDLTQAFIVHLLEQNALGQYRRERGRFRSFLLTCLKHFLANERDYRHAAKRGGGASHVPFDLAIETAEYRYRMEPREPLTPDKVFEKRWALEVLDQAASRLREEFVRAGKSEQFDRFRSHLTGADAATPYRQLARESGMTEGAVRVAIHRLRQRYHQALRDVISLTVIDAKDLSDEIRHLIGAIRG